MPVAGRSDCQIQRRSSNLSFTIGQPSSFRSPVGHGATTLPATITNPPSGRGYDAGSNGADGHGPAAEGKPRSEYHDELSSPARLGSLRVFGWIIGEHHAWSPGRVGPSER